MAEENIKIAAVISIPMCGWNPHWGCVLEALRPFQIPVRTAYGAYWHQSMSNLLEEAVENDLDWVLTLDYDSMFRQTDLDRLLGEFGQNPHIDALAALQCKRGTEQSPLMTVQGMTEIQVTGEPIQADTAHFGMTLIRIDALKRMKKPWFVSRPNANGSYSDEKRTDADIYFWQEWMKCGNTIYVDPLCAIGHLQPMVSEFDEHFEPRHVHVMDWRKRGGK